MRKRERESLSDSYENNSVQRRNVKRAFIDLEILAALFFHALQNLFCFHKVRKRRSARFVSISVEYILGQRSVNFILARDLPCSFFQLSEHYSKTARYHKYLHHENTIAIFRSLVICATRNQYCASKRSGKYIHVIQKESNFPEILGTFK